MYSIFETLLEKTGESVADVCRATGIAQSTMSNWKKRNNALSAKNARLIADHFNVSIDYLMGKEDKVSYQTQAQLLFEGQLRLEGWEIEHYFPADGKPCMECLSRGEVDGVPWWGVDGAKDPGRLCEKCLIPDSRYILKRGDVKLSFTNEEYRSIVSRNQYEAATSVLKFADGVAADDIWMLEPEEQRHIVNYRKLSASYQRNVDEYTDTLLSVQDMELRAAHKRTDIAPDKDAEAHDIEEMDKF